MPTYEYRCTACAHLWEETQKMADPRLELCPSCGKKGAERLISQTSFALKGGGWYAQGYGATSPPAAAPAPVPMSGVSASTMATATTVPTKTAATKV